MSTAHKSPSYIFISLVIAISSSVVAIAISSRFLTTPPVTVKLAKDDHALLEQMIGGFQDPRAALSRIDNLQMQLAELREKAFARTIDGPKNSAPIFPLPVASASLNSNESSGNLRGGTRIELIPRCSEPTTSPQVLSMARPRYSTEALKAKWQGSVILTLEVGADGNPKNIMVKRSLGLGLDEEAIESVRQWKFRPATNTCGSVLVPAVAEVQFTLLASTSPNVSPGNAPPYHFYASTDSQAERQRFEVEQQRQREEMRLKSEMDLKNDIAPALAYLNRIRANPPTFSEEIGVDLGHVHPQSPLKWNDTLARAARQRAEDMANRDYFGYVDPDGLGANYVAKRAGYCLPALWDSSKGSNDLESIYAGAGPTEAIKHLIRDSGNDEYPWNRLHLLGIGELMAARTDVGIGVAYSEKSKYTTYVSILTARQDSVEGVLSWPEDRPGTPDQRHRRSGVFQITVDLKKENKCDATPSAGCLWMSSYGLCPTCSLSSLTFTLMDGNKRPVYSHSVNSQRQLSIPKLKPGLYTLKIRAEKEEGTFIGIPIFPRSTTEFGLCVSDGQQCN